MTEHVWLELIAAIVLVTGQIINYLKSKENTTKIDGVHRDMNSKLTELIKAKEAIAHASGFIEGSEKESAKIDIKSASKMTEQMSEVWRYLRARAKAEIIRKELVNLSDMTVKSFVKQWFSRILPDIILWYSNNKFLDDDNLFISCHRTLGERLLIEICTANSLFDGACIELTIMIAKENEASAKI